MATRSRTNQRGRSAESGDDDNSQNGDGYADPTLDWRMDDDDSADADNEGTVMYKRKDQSMANAGRRNQRRVSRTAKKRNKGRRGRQ